MTTKKEAPEALRETTRAITQCKCNKNLPRIQQMVYNLLLSGEKYSAADISIELHLSDPRSHIAELRNKGFLISDEWIMSPLGSRYKLYFLRMGM